MATYVGLHLASAQARILEAEGSAKKLKVKKFTTVDLATPDRGSPTSVLSKETADLITKAFAKGKIAREPLAMSWDSDLTVFREMNLPFTGHDQIQKVIKYEAESHLHNCDIDDVVVTFYKLSEERDKSHLLVMAARKDQLLNRFEVLARGGIDPIMVDLDVMASFNALSAVGYTEEHKSFMVLDCGRRTTNVLIISNGRLVSGRAIRLGSDSLTRRIASDLGADPAQIAQQTVALLDDPDKRHADDLLVPMVSGRDLPEPMKRPEDLAHEIAVSEAEGFYGRLSREVRRTLVTTRLPEAIEVVYVTGPGSLLPGFVDAIVAQLPVEAPVRKLNLLEHVDCSLKDVDLDVLESELLTPLGLAFKIAGHDETGVDFRQEEARYARKFDQIREPLIYFCGFLLFLVLLVNLFDVRKLSVRQPFLVQQNVSDMYRIHQQAFTMFQRTLGKDEKVPVKFAKASVQSIDYMRRRMDQRIEDLKSQLGRGGAIPELPSAFQMWKDAFESISPYMERMGKLWLENVTIAVSNQKEPYIQFDGLVQNASAYSDLAEAVRKIPGVARIEQASLAPLPGPDGQSLTQFKALKVIYPERKEY